VPYTGEALQAAERIELCFVVSVGVDLQRDGQARMPEDDLGIAGRDAKHLEQRYRTREAPKMFTRYTRHFESTWTNAEDWHP
jgi:hypothetical protein